MGHSTKEVFRKEQPSIFNMIPCQIYVALEAKEHLLKVYGKGYSKPSLSVVLRNRTIVIFLNLRGTAFVVVDSKQVGTRHFMRTVGVLFRNAMVHLNCLCLTNRWCMFSISVMYGI